VWASSGSLAKDTGELRSDSSRFCRIFGIGLS
jgi:hypothetical protein